MRWKDLHDDLHRVFPCFGEVLPVLHIVYNYYY